MADVKDLADLRSEEDELGRGNRKLLNDSYVGPLTSLEIIRRGVNHSIATSEVGSNVRDWEFCAGAPPPLCMYMIASCGNGRLVPDIHTSTPTTGSYSFPVSSAFLPRRSPRGASRVTVSTNERLDAREVELATERR